MVVVRLEPTVRFMDRSGMGTRKVAARLWGDTLPDRDPAMLVRELYAAENAGQAEPSGSQDMIGLIYPGVNRLDHDIAHEGSYFPVHIESNNDPRVVRWLERVIWVIPVMQRPPGYSPFGVKNLDPAWIQRLGQSGKDCYKAILAQDTRALGASMMVAPSGHASFCECRAAGYIVRQPCVLDHPLQPYTLKRMFKISPFCTT